MSTRLYVGNLSFNTNEAQLRDLFATHGPVTSADLIMDSAANVLVRESFSAFGARRGSNWQSIPLRHSDHTG